MAPIQSSVSSTASPFPIGSRVIIQDLVKALQYNGKAGVVKSSLDSRTLRQSVFVADANKSIAIKIANMRYEPRDLESLSAEECIDLIIHSQKKDDKELETLIFEDRSGGVKGLQKVIRDEISNRPDEIAELLAKIKVGHDVFAASFDAARAEGGCSSQSELSPAKYLKKKYRQFSTRDKEDELKLGCRVCGKNDVSLSKCSRCLSVLYCTKACQKKDYKEHKKECNELMIQRKKDTANEVDRACWASGMPTIPYVGLALDCSLTGMPGEVICDVPLWDFESGARMNYDNTNASGVAKAVKYFFKIHQSSVASARCHTTADVGGMCADAIILYYLNHPGVRRITAKEGRGSERRKFTSHFSCTSQPPKDWKMKAEDGAHLPRSTLAAMEESTERVRDDPRYKRHQ